MPTQPELIHYLPIATTLVAIPFVVSLLRRYRARGEGLHLLWWAAGVACFGLGTAMESAITLWGNTPWLNKSWYVAGAVLGAYPLAQGSAYLLLRQRTAHVLTAVTLPVALLLSALVLASPVATGEMEAHRPGGAALDWPWVRAVTPLLNVYAAGMLVGGAAWSSWRYARTKTHRWRAIGNGLIALGALLPAIGGGMAKMGTVEALYIGEFLGLVLIGLGYLACLRR